MAVLDGPAAAGTITSTALCGLVASAGSQRKGAHCGRANQDQDFLHVRTREHISRLAPTLFHHQKRLVQVSLSMRLERTRPGDGVGQGSGVSEHHPRAIYAAAIAAAKRTFSDLEWRGEGWR